AETAGMVVRPEQEVVVVTPQDREEEIVIRLARIGFDRVAGYLREPEGAFLGAPERVAPPRRVTGPQLATPLHPVPPASRVTAPQLATALHTPLPPVLLDVRNPGELAEGAIPGAWH